MEIVSTSNLVSLEAKKKKRKKKKTVCNLKNGTTVNKRCKNHM